MKSYLAVGFGGMAGSLLRAAVFAAGPEQLALWLVNVTGSYVLGLLSVRLSSASSVKKGFFTTGLLGSFTTFSAFSAEWLRLLEQSLFSGLVHGLLMTAVCAAAAAAGMKTGKSRVRT